MQFFTISSNVILLFSFIIYKTSKLCFCCTIIFFNFCVNLKIKKYKEFWIDFQKIAKRRLELKDEYQALIGYNKSLQTIISNYNV